MSVLIGIICPDAIVLATDSQLTDLSDGDTSDADKISKIELHFDDILIAKGGRVATYQPVVEIIRDKAKNVKITDKRSVLRILEESISKYKNGLDEDRSEKPRHERAILMVAFYVGNKPHLYQVDIFGDIVEAEGKYLAISVKPDWSNFLLREFIHPEYGAGFNLASVVELIEKTKKHNGYCGGYTNVKWLWPVPSGIPEPRYVGKCQRMNAEFLERFEKRLPELDANVKEFRNKQIAAAIREIHKEVETARQTQPK